jgi:uncharacterized membrane-anchored protein
MRIIANTAALLLAVAAGLPALADEGASAPDQDARVAELKRQIAALNWIEGPKRVELFNNSALELPAGYKFLNPVDTAKLESLTQNLGGGTQYFLAPDDLRWEAYFSYSDDGYVKDEEKIDADAILDNIKQNTAAANEERRKRGWHEMAVTGWQTAPHYDTQTRQLEWAINGKDVADNEAVVNFNTRILGRGGVTSVVLLTDPQGLDAAIGEFKQTVSGFSYLPGQKYAEYKPGDKIAKYGLAALITGGAAAIAVKTGFWKVLVTGLVAGWKFIAAGAVALFGGLSRLFKRKNS